MPARPIAAGPRRRQCLAAGALAWAGAPALATPHADPWRPLRVPVQPLGRLLFQRPDGRLDGVFPSVVPAIEAETGLRVRLELVPRARQLALFFDSHEVDLLWPATRLPARDRAAIPTLASLDRLSVVTAASAPPTSLRWDSLSVAPPGKAVVVRGMQFGGDVDRWNDQASVDGRAYVVPDLVAALRLLLAGRAAFLLMPASAVFSVGDGQPALAFENFRCEPLQGVAPLTVCAYLSRHTRPPEVIQRVIAGLNRVMTRGVMERAMRRYLPAELVARDMRFPAPA